MAVRPATYPTLPQIRYLSNQELYDKRLAGLNLPSLAGTTDTRPKS